MLLSQSGVPLIQSKGQLTIIRDPYFIWQLPFVTFRRARGTLDVVGYVNTIEQLTGRSKI
jgi:hypothetical protein